MSNSSSPASNMTDWITFFDEYIRGESWVNKCALQISGAHNRSESIDFVDKNGSLLTSSSNVDLIWGVTLQACVTHCSRSTLPMQFDFETFSSGVTNFFLPFLFLTAQLPFETGLPDKNLMSFYIAVGSPVLITFSLFITALNGHYIFHRFELLSESQNHFLHFQLAVQAARDFLRGSQQSPIRINGHAFDILFQYPDEIFGPWWQSLHSRLERTRRPFTFPLVAQGLFAVLVWVLTIAYNFATSLGDPSSALLLSSGTLWLWLVPVVVGWVFVSTQYMEGGVKNALLEYTEGGFRPSSEVGLEARSGLTSRSAHRMRGVGPRLWSSVQGDEKVQGPAFNYARCLTVPQLAESVAQAFECKLSLLRQYTAVQIGHHSTYPPSIFGSDRHRLQIPLVTTAPPDIELVSATGSASEIESLADQQASIHLGVSDESSDHGRRRSTITGPTLDANLQHRTRSRTSRDSIISPNPSMPPNSNDNTDQEPLGPGRQLGLDAYVEWSDVNSAWKKNILVANVLALFLQWGVTSAAVLIAYNTPARGIGCRPSSYLLYAILATVAHFLLLASVFLSHDAMLVHQRYYPHPPNAKSLRTRLKIVSVLAVVTRIAGKFVAATNTCWIILSSFFEMIGLYNSCFCEGSMLIPNEKAWVLLFRHDEVLRREAQGYWAGGVVMSASVCFVTFLAVFMYSSRR